MELLISKSVILEFLKYFYLIFLQLFAFFPTLFRYFYFLTLNRKLKKQSSITADGVDKDVAQEEEVEFLPLDDLAGIFSFQKEK